MSYRRELFQGDRLGIKHNYGIVSSKKQGGSRSHVVLMLVSSIMRAVIVTGTHKGNNIKKLITIVVAAVIILGAGFWVFFSLRLAPSTPESKDRSQVDSTAPTIQLIITDSDLAFAKTSKVIEVSAKATDNHLIKRVEYLLDGTVVARSIEPPFKATITIAHLHEGEHTLQAVAYDAAGNSTKSKVFTFIVESDAATPADESSRTIVRTSSQRGGTAINSSDTTGSTTTPGGIDGGGGSSDDVRTAGGWWAALPSRMQVCSNNIWDSGPSSPPANSITVPAGDNTGFNFNQTGKTFWFAPGEHTLGSGEFSQITPGSGSTYIGAPGAIIDGKNQNRYAFAGTASNVRLAYLEIRNFGRGLDNNNEGVINHDSGTGWTMEYLNAHHNDGAAVFLGSNNTVRYSCLKDNGQYGASMYKPQVEGDAAIKDIVIHNNEISGNNQDDWETLIDGCGCTGGVKFWDVEGATVTDNYVHDNLSMGLWADTNDIDFLFDSNWIEHNDGVGIWYEISYNATISRNVMKRNAWVSGNENLGSPAPAIYISESGGDSRLQSSTSGSTDLRINNNLIEDNFSGVSIYENANRFCNSNGNTSKTYCTPFVSPTIIPPPYDYDYLDPINATHPCYTNIADEPYRTECRWHSKNVKVFSNEFRFTEANVPCAGTYCGAQALIATGADNLPWMPYTVTEVQDDVMFNNGNLFSNNSYFGNWKFAKRWGDTIGWNVWRTAPYHQDVGSVFDGDSVPPVDNALDADTATLEGSIGRWAAWYSDTISRTTQAAHSGTYGLQVDVTAGGGWGVELNNWPGFTATPGTKQLSFWAKQGSGTISGVTLRVKWFNGAQQLTQTDLVQLNSLSTSWQQATLTVSAPADTATVFLEFISTSGSAGDTLHLDDIVIADET